MPTAKTAIKGQPALDLSPPSEGGVVTRRELMDVVQGGLTFVNGDGGDEEPEHAKCYGELEECLLQPAASADKGTALETAYALTLDLKKDDGDESQ